ncbi:MAG: isoprenylcysteine carboxylmethyltransferase family protein [Candidatus Helarchaeota archaeon]|nr:isoprenylcysteine carboxylmethyltransferase family protein [Candidatus Helarchaeota archaeon]
MAELAEKSEELKKALVQMTVRTIIGLALMSLALFLSVGHLDVPRGWLTLGLYLGFAITEILIFYKWNPDLIIARMQRRIGPYKWDKVFMVLLGVFLYGMFVVYGLDIRFQWWSLNKYYIIVGLVLFLVGGILLTWSMVVNRYFENIVRIQTDRAHKVISAGPYSVIRHPGYLGAGVQMIAFPFIIGSGIGLFIVIAIIIMMVVRTSLEDKTLQNELDGYAEYAKRVKYKLIPYIW